MAIENETEKSEPTSSRDAVEAAFDAYEKAGPDAGLITLEKSEEPADAAAADKAALGGEEPAHEVADERSGRRGGDPRTGQFKKGDKGAKAPVVQAKGGHESVTPREPSATAPPPVAAAPASDRSLRAPQSWRPGAREGFDKLPVAARQEIWRLDAEREKVVREAAQHRHAADEWQRCVAPYEQSIRASGAEPMQAVGNVMRTVYALGTQPEPVRANIVHNLMKMYGVSVESLAKVIDGNPVAQETAPSGPQQTFDPRFDEFYRQYQYDQQARQQQANTAADAELEGFAKDHEFLDDLLPEMNDFMAVAAQRGVAMDYEAAYNRSIALRPDLMEILQQRAAVGEPNGPTQCAIRASSGVRGSPSRRPASGQKQFKDSREAAAAAYDQASGESSRV